VCCGRYVVPKQPVAPTFRHKAQSTGQGFESVLAQAAPATCKNHCVFVQCQDRENLSHILSHIVSRIDPRRIAMYAGQRYRSLRGVLFRTGILAAQDHSLRLRLFLCIRRNA
jgi:hypothetical protein